MVFKTRWNPTDAANELEGIARNDGHGGTMGNIGQHVETDPDGRGGYVIRAESREGHYHNTGVQIHVRPDETGRGSVVTVEGDHKTGSQEAASVEKDLAQKYFNK